MDSPLNADTMARQMPPLVKEKPKRRPGRPREYNLEVAIEFCDRVGECESIKKICADPAMPAAATIWRWMATIEEFRAAFQCAILAKLDARCDEIIEIADDAAHDYRQETDADGLPVSKPNPELLRRTEMRIEARKYQMAKEFPRKYGVILPSPPMSEGGIFAPQQLTAAPMKLIDPPTEDPLKEAIGYWRGAGVEQAQ